MTTSCGPSDKPSARGPQPGPPEGRWPVVHSRNRRHLPEVRCLSTESDAPIVDTLDCLPSAFRSQGLSPSQRFDPGTPSWLLFQATSVRRLHGPSELLPSRSAVVPLGTPLLSCHRALQGAPASRCVCDTSEASVRQAERKTLAASPEALAPELCSDRASDTPHDE